MGDYDEAKMEAGDETAGDWIQQGRDEMQAEIVKLLDDIMRYATHDEMILIQQIKEKVKKL